MSLTFGCRGITAYYTHCNSSIIFCFVFSSRKTWRHQGGCEQTCPLAEGSSPLLYKAQYSLQEAWQFHKWAARTPGGCFVFSPHAQLQRCRRILRAAASMQATGLLHNPQLCRRFFFFFFFLFFPVKVEFSWLVLQCSLEWDKLHKLYKLRKNSPARVQLWRTKMQHQDSSWRWSPQAPAQEASVHKPKSTDQLRAQQWI